MTRKRITYNVLFSFMSWIIPLGLSFLLTPVIVGGLGPEKYGLYILIMGMVGYLAALNFNIGRALTKYIAGYQADQQTDQISQGLSSTLWLYMGIGLINVVMVVFLSDWLVKDVFNITASYHQMARVSLWLAATGLFFTLLIQVFGAVPQAAQRFDLYGTVIALSAAGSIGGNAVMVWLGFDVSALIGWVALVNFITGSTFCIIALRLVPDIKLTWNFKKSTFIEIIKFSGWVSGYQIFGSLLVLFERSWLTRSVGSVGVTFYVVPMIIAMYIHGFIGSITLLLFPMLSETNAQGEWVRMQQIYMRSSKYVSALIVFLVITLIVVGQKLLLNWMGEDFALQTKGVLEIQAVVFGLLAFAIVPWQLSDGLGFPERNAFLSFLWLLIAGFFAIWLTPSMNIIGMGVARLIAVLTVPIYIFFVEKRTWGRPLYRFWWKIGLSLAFAGVITGFLERYILAMMKQGWAAILISVIVGMVAFTLSLVGTRYLNPEEREFIKRSIGDLAGFWGEMKKRSS
jgi:O-antigen/teichoic acid export membrane protein